VFVTIYFGLILYVNCVYIVLHILSTQSYFGRSSDKHGRNGRKQEVGKFLAFVVAGIGGPKHLDEVVEAQAEFTLFVLLGVGVEQDPLDLSAPVEGFGILSVLRALISIEPESRLAELLTVHIVFVSGRGLGSVQSRFGGEFGCLEDKVSEELSPVHAASVAGVHVAHHALHSLSVDELPSHRHTVLLTSKLLGVVDLSHHHVNNKLVGEQ